MTAEMPEAWGGVLLTTRVLEKSEPHSTKERSSTDDSFPTPHPGGLCSSGKELIRMAATSALTFYDLLIEAFKQSGIGLCKRRQCWYSNLSSRPTCSRSSMPIGQTTAHWTQYSASTS